MLEELKLNHNQIILGVIDKETEKEQERENLLKGKIINIQNASMKLKRRDQKKYLQLKGLKYNKKLCKQFKNMIKKYKNSDNSIFE